MILGDRYKCGACGAVMVLRGQDLACPRCPPPADAPTPFDTSTRPTPSIPKRPAAVIRPKWLAAKIREFVTACTGADWPGRTDQAHALLVELPVDAPVVLRFTPRSRVTSRVTPTPAGRIDKTALPFPAVAPGKSQRERKLETNARSFTIRGEVLSRARIHNGGRCEFCGIGEAIEMHHTLGGSDRIALQHPTNCAAVCAGGPGAAPECHEQTEISPAWDLEHSLRWARRMAGDRRFSDADRAGFALTVERLEARAALAAAQAVTPHQGGTDRAR